MKKIRATAWWRVTCLRKGISARALANLPYQVKVFDCCCGFILNGIASKFTMRIHHTYGNVYKQFCKPVNKIRATAWWWASCLCKGISAWSKQIYHITWMDLIAPAAFCWMASPPNLPCVFTISMVMTGEGMYCSCGFHFDWHRHQIYHAYLPFIW